MRIKKFNESFDENGSPFTNYRMMENLIAPILKYDCTIHYKLYTMFGEEVMPVGPAHIENFSNSDFWDKYSKEDLYLREKTQIHGAIIEINDKVFTLLSTDSASSNYKTMPLGRLFSSYDSDKLINILEDIDRIKEDCKTDGYTLSLFLNNNGFKEHTVFNKQCQISLLILDGIF